MRFMTAIWRFVQLATRGSGGRLAIGVAIGIAISALSIWILASAVDTEAALRLVARADLLLLLAALVPLTVGMLVRTGRWGVLLRAASPRRPLATRDLLPIVLASYAANSVLPVRLGDVARAVVGARRLRTGLPETMGSVGLERVLDAGALALVALAASLVADVPGWLIQSGFVLLLAAATFVALVYLVHRLGQRRYRGSQSGLARLGRGLRSSPRAISVAFVLSALVWCIDGVTFWLVARAIGVEISWVAALLIATGAAAGGILPSAPAAVGTYELAGTAVGIALGLDSASALGVAVLSHLATVVPLLAAGAVAVPVIGLGRGDLRTPRAGGPVPESAA